MRNLVVVAVSGMLVTAGIGTMVGCSSDASAEADILVASGKAKDVVKTEKPAKTEVGMPAITVFLAPPGTPIAIYDGATSKDELAATLQKSSSACGPGGCGPQGCGPK